MDKLYIRIEREQNGIQAGQRIQYVPIGEEHLLDTLQYSVIAHIQRTAAELGLEFDLDHTTQEASCQPTII